MLRTKDEARDYTRAVETVSEEFEESFKKMFGQRKGRGAGIQPRKPQLANHLESLEEVFKESYNL